MISPKGSRSLTINGRTIRTVFSLIAWRAATAAPAPNSSLTKLIPLIPPGAAPNNDVIGSIPNSRLLQRPIATPLKTNVIVITNAGFQSFARVLSELVVNDVPMIVPIAI